MATIMWKDGYIKNPSPASDADVAAHEAELGFKLPAAFLAIAQFHQGASPRPRSIKIPDGFGTAVQGLLHFREDVAWFSNIVSRRVPLEDVVAPEIIPFAQDIGQDLFCFDYRATLHQPSVVFWSVDTGLLTLSASFEGFLDLLCADPYDDDDDD